MDAAYSAVQHDQTVYCENRCTDFSLLLLLSAYEQIFGADKQVSAGRV
jgi:hypothetical protein